MSSDSSYTTDYSSSVDSEKERSIRIAYQEIEATNRFDFLNKIGSGSYGDVFSVKDKTRNAQLALKVISNEDVSRNETDFWPQLLHPNIMPLFETIEYSSTHAYLMPVVKYSLYDVVYKTDFCDSTSCWRKLKLWLQQILCGLEYMHGNQFCHLDVKADNVLISEKEVTMLCDFSCIKSTSQTITTEDFGLPSIYWPPDVHPYLHTDEMKIDGIAFDQWSFGVMTLEILTDATISDQVDTINNNSSDSNTSSCDLWFRDLYPVLLRETREKRFKYSVRSCFPNVKSEIQECRHALDFILVFLEHHPNHRWTACQGKRHAFFKIGKFKLERLLQEGLSKIDVPADHRAFTSTTVSSEKL